MLTSSVFLDRPRHTLWLTLFCLSMGVMASLALDLGRSGRRVGLFFACCAIALIVPTTRFVALCVLQMASTSVCWGWLSSTITLSRLYLVSGLLYVGICVVQWAVWYTAWETPPLYLVVALTISGLIWCLTPIPARAEVPSERRQGTLQRMVRVRSNGWVLVYALWSAIPRAMLRSDLFRSALHDRDTHRNYVVAVVVGATLTCSFSQLLTKRGNLGTPMVARLNGLLVFGTSMTATWAMHSHAILPSIYVVLTGMLLGGCEPAILTLGMVVNETTDRVLFLALYLMTTSVGSCIGDMIEHLFLATNSAPSMSAIGYLTWMLGTLILISLGNAAAHDDRLLPTEVFVFAKTTQPPSKV